MTVERQQPKAEASFAANPTPVAMPMKLVTGAARTKTHVESRTDANWWKKTLAQEVG